MEWSRSTELKVGIFIVGSGILALAVILSVGSESAWMEDQIYFKTSFGDAGGLRKGAPVRVGGRSAGSVDDIRYAEDLRRSRVIITFHVSPAHQDRVRQNSIARLGSKGVLGDKVLDITMGTSDTPAIRPWGWVASGKASGVMDRAEQAVARAEETLEQAQKVLQIFTDEGMVRDIQGTVRGLHQITVALNEGDGAAHALLYDPETKESLRSALDGIASSSRELAGTSREVRTILHDARTGKGAVHALLYDPEGAQALNRVGRAADELATVLHDVRTEHGLVHSLIYTDEQQNLLENLTETSAGVRQIVADLRAGRGTIGALLVDPSVYEDLKRVVGNVGRSRALRALVRYAITEDEQEPAPPQVQRPARAGGQ